jgi:hypothetical protein
MSLLWAVPPVALATGAAMVLAQLRSIANATVDLQGELRRFHEVQVAVAEVRTASAAARAQARSIRRI